MIRQERLRVVIVDDEPMAREGLRLRLASQRDVEVVAECESADDGARAIERFAPDVVFLDVQMPERDGFALLQQLERAPLPAVIFVTAHADHAVQAFRVGALDYLVKPYDDDTLHESVERARAYLRQVRAIAPDRQRQHDEAAPEGFMPTRLTIRDRGHLLFVDTTRIDWVEADGDHVRIHVGDSHYQLRSTMRDLAARLDPALFVRVHRTAIVAVDRIRELQPYSRGEHVVVLTTGAKLPMSRRYRTRVAQAMEGTT